MSSYQAFLDAAYRRAVLRFLLAQPDGQLSEPLLIAQLEADALYAEQTERRAHLALLAGNGLCSVRQLGTIQLVQLTERGRLVALGKLRVDGIADNTLPSG